MGKKSKYPKYSTESVDINGQNIATAQKHKKNTINSSYTMSDAEKAIYDGIQENLATSLQDLFTISDETQKKWDNQLESYKQSGINEINSIYDPMQNELKNDIAARFGNLDNSVFMDSLNNITNKKAQAVADLSESLLQTENDMYTTELANRLNYISLLSGLNTTMNNNMLSFMQLANANSSSGNSHNSDKYQATLYNPYAQTLNAIANVGQTALKFTYI
jgi:hypothetical protein